MNSKFTALSDRVFFVHKFPVFCCVPGDFPFAQRMRDGHQWKHVDLSFPAQFES